MLDLLICTTNGQLVFVDAVGKLINIHQVSQSIVGTISVTMLCSYCCLALDNTVEYIFYYNTCEKMP